MKRALVLLAIVASGGASAALSRADEEKKLTLPVRPFLLAEADDWSTGVVTTRLLTRSNPAQLPERAATWRIAKVEDETVTVEIHDPPGTIETRVFPRRAEPTLEEWTGQRGRTFSDVKVEDDECTWDGRDLPAKRVRFKASGANLPEQEHELWLSRHARGSTVIAWRVKEKRGDEVVLTEYELRGFGNGAVAEAGMTPPDDEPPAPHERATVLAHLCDSCAIRAGERCFSCGGGVATKVEAQLCRRCVPARSADACASCGSPFARKPARLCVRCSAPGARDVCANSRRSPPPPSRR